MVTWVRCPTPNPGRTPCYMTRHVLKCPWVPRARRTNTAQDRKCRDNFQTTPYRKQEQWLPNARTFGVPVKISSTTKGCGRNCSTAGGLPTQRFPVTALWSRPSARGSHWHRMCQVTGRDIDNCNNAIDPFRAVVVRSCRDLLSIIDDPSSYVPGCTLGRNRPRVRPRGGAAKHDSRCVLKTGPGTNKLLLTKPGGLGCGEPVSHPQGEHQKTHNQRASKCLFKCSATQTNSGTNKHASKHPGSATGIKHASDVPRCLSLHPEQVGALLRRPRRARETPSRAPPADIVSLTMSVRISVDVVSFLRGRVFHGVSLRS